LSLESGIRNPESGLRPIGLCCTIPPEEYKQGTYQFTSLIPLSPGNVEVPANRKAWEALRNFEKLFLAAFSDSEPSGMKLQFEEEIPWAKVKTM
tara:strand:- start:225 stop:506 length:282 start_codon:yes stop_codon:yes gene_type:complete